MAKVKEGHVVLFLELPEPLKLRLREIGKRNHRSMVGEAVVAIERHVAIEEERLGLSAASAPQTPEQPAAEPAKGKGKKGGGK